MAADEVGGELELGVELLELGEEAMDEVAGAGAAAGVVAEADDELLELPDATNRHGAVSRARGAGRTDERKGESARERWRRKGRGNGDDDDDEQRRRKP